LAVFVQALSIVHPEMVDFGSGQGLSDFETDSVAVIVSTGIAHGYFEDFKSAQTKLRAKRCRFWMDTI